MAKTDNRPSAMKAKIEMRRRILSRMEKSNVLDAFCGIDGFMHDQVWIEADTYVGIDTEYKWPDMRSRFVANNIDVMRVIDLSKFNVFDFDAYGSPWEQMLLMAQRRKWATGEIGAVVVTDGSSGKIKFGELPRALASVLALDRRQNPPTSKTYQWLLKRAMKAWLMRCHLDPMESWISVSTHGASGSQMMVYSAVVFVAK